MMLPASKNGVLPFVSLVFRIVLGIMFLYAGVVHAHDPHGFHQAVANYRILPAIFINPFAVVLPWIEILSGTSLILGIFIPGSSLIVTALLLVFSIALSIDLYRGLDISCGCFTTSRDAQHISWIYLVRDLILSVMAVSVFFFDTGLGTLPKILRLKR